ncbi:MAG: VOC family protein [Novosphingobium sp.]
MASPLVAEDKAPAPAAAVALLGPALHVGNIDKELKFYIDGLGMKLLMQMGPPQRHETMLGFGGTMGQPAIILLSDSTGTAPPIPVMGNKFDRLVLRVSRLSEVIARLRALGYTATDVRSVAMGYSMASATDPDGYKLELVENSMAKAK